MSFVLPQNWSRRARVRSLLLGLGLLAIIIAQPATQAMWIMTGMVLFAVYALIMGGPWWSPRPVSGAYFRYAENGTTTLTWNDIDSTPGREWRFVPIVLFWMVAGFVMSMLVGVSALQALYYAAGGILFGILAGWHAAKASRMHRRGISVTYDGMVSPIGKKLPDNGNWSLPIADIRSIEVGLKKDWIGYGGRWMTQLAKIRDGQRGIVYALNQWNQLCIMSESTWDRGGCNRIHGMIQCYVTMLTPIVAEYRTQCAKRPGDKPTLDAWLEQQVNGWIDREILGKVEAARAPRTATPTARPAVTPPPVCAPQPVVQPRPTAPVRQPHVQRRPLELKAPPRQQADARPSATRPLAPPAHLRTSQTKGEQPTRTPTRPIPPPRRRRRRRSQAGLPSWRQQIIAALDWLKSQLDTPASR